MFITPDFSFSAIQQDHSMPSVPELPAMHLQILVAQAARLKLNKDTSHTSAKKYFAMQRNAADNTPAVPRNKLSGALLSASCTGLNRGMKRQPYPKMTPSPPVHRGRCLRQGCNRGRPLFLVSGSSVVTMGTEGCDVGQTLGPRLQTNGWLLHPRAFPPHREVGAGWKSRQILLPPPSSSSRF